MMLTRSLTPLVPALIAGLLAAPALGQTVKIDGSSTVYPITAAVAEEFKADSGIDVELGVSGTGGGFGKFTAGQTDISNASRQIKAGEARDAADAGIGFIEIPVAYDGLTIVVNKANNWATQLTVDQLRKIFTAPGAKTWREVDPSFPATPIKLYTPGEASGTYDYFVEVVCGSRDKATGRYEHGAMREDLSRSEDDNILVTGVTGDAGAIGYFGCAYYFANEDKINAVAIVNGEGQAVRPTPETIEAGAYEPFSRPLFIYASATSLKRPEVREFVEFYLSEGPELAEEVGYVRLPGSVYDAAERNVRESRTGSMYLDADGNVKHGTVTEMFR